MRIGNLYGDDNRTYTLCHPMGDSHMPYLFHFRKTRVVPFCGLIKGGLDPFNLATYQFGAFGVFGPPKSVLDDSDLKRVSDQFDTFGRLECTR